MHTRGLIRVFVVLAVLGGGLGGVSAHAASPDWAFAKVHFPSGGQAAVEGTAVANGAGPVVIGLGSAFGGGGFVDVFNVGNGGISFKTTDTLGSVAIQVTPPTGGTFHVGIGVGLFSKSPADIDLLVFVANASFTTVSTHASGGTVQPTSGSGTQAIYVAGPGTSGIAADASAAAAGTSTTARQVPAGLVGAATHECFACTIGWTSPDGTSGSTTEANVPFPVLPPTPPLPVPVPVPLFLPGGVAMGDPAFAGPAGSWQWTWTGATVKVNPTTAVGGAYAPIGDAWHDFRGGTTGGSAGGGASFGGSGGSVGGGSGSSHPSTHVAGKQVSRTLANTGVESDAVAWMLLLVACVAGCRLRRVTS